VTASGFVPLDQGFLTWGAEINFRGCWRRSHMRRSKVCPWAFLHFLIVFVNAIAIIAVFVLENEPSIWSRCTALVFTLSL